jgi:sulfide dehydrogenase cytochrome subunit
MKLPAVTLILSIGLGSALVARAGDPAAACAGCHGTDGISSDASVPTITGMSFDYFADSMHAYQKKLRSGTEMTIISGDKKGSKSDMVKAVADLSDADIDALAKIYSNKKFIRAKQSADPALAAKGKEIHDKLCDKCHTEGGSAASDDSGILAGQWMPYLKAQMVDYKTGKRPVPTKMQPKLDQVQTSDFDALVAYYGSAK